ncbi:MAG: right-handed parallel beta-helix repeat-containing protein [Methylophilaceae bacterium]
MNKILHYMNSVAWIGILAIFTGDVVAKDIQLTPENIKATWNKIQPGDRVNFAAGEYRDELLLLANKPWSVSQPTSFISKTPNAAIVKGSDIVQDWQKLDGSRYVKDWASETSQVFVDGVALKQLGGTVFDGFPENPASTYNNLNKEKGGIWPGRVAYASNATMPNDSFFYDRLTKKLYINTKGDINKRKVEVSVRRRPFYAEGVSGITLDGLLFEHSNTSISGRGGAVTIIGNDNVIRNVTVRHTDLAGIQTVGDRNQLLNSIANYNGQMGVTMRGANNRVIGVEASHNNTRGFNKWWEAGGFKFVGDGGLHNSEIVNNVAIDNQGDGIWFDWQNKHNLIKGNVAAYNTGFGIHYELSQFGKIENNYVYGNGQRGIFLRDSANCEISNNMVIANGLEGIVAVYTGQKDGKGVEFGSENAIVTSNVVGWNTGGALIMPKGASAIGISDMNVYLGDDKSTKFSLGYPSTLSPAVYSLSDWQNQSGLDVHSASSSYGMPKSILDSIAKRELITDWSVIDKVASPLVKGQAVGPHRNK